MMGDQKFTCGRYKNRAFEDIAQSDPDFCKAVLASPVCNKYYPQEFKSYLLSVKGAGVTSICANNVTSFVAQWDDTIRAEFEQIIGSPEVVVREAHPPAAGPICGNLGVFVRFFFKKCIFNVQNVNAVNHNIELFASIFPFRASKSVPSARLPVRDLFDGEFLGTVAAFMVGHFEDKCDSTDRYVDLFLRNIHHFKDTHFDARSVRKLKTLVAGITDLHSRRAYVNDYRATVVNAYLDAFPRLNRDGVARYTTLRRMYNSLCAAFGLEGLGEWSAEHFRMLPEINCYELLSLLEPDFYAGQRSKYVEYFLKYLFFFVYAVESVQEHPILFIDDPLYECLKGYAEYRDSREMAEKLQLCIWQVTLVYRRTQEVDLCKFNFQFAASDENLRNVREYIENFEGVESAIVDYVLPTDLLMLGVSVVIGDAVFNLSYRRVDKLKIDFHEDIIRALMCPMDIKRAIIYNGYTGKEMSVIVPPRKTQVLEFVRRYNEYDPNGPDAKRDMFKISVAGFLHSAKLN